MAGSVNKAILIGNLGRDPEVRHGAGGDKIVSLSVATSESWKDKTSGERKERTEWHRVVIFDERIADTAEKYLKKGAKVYIEGQVKTRKWTGNDGQDRYTTEIVLPKFNAVLTMLDRRTGDTPPPAGDAGDYGTESAPPSGDGAPPPDLDDEIPF